ncbi:protein 4.1 homolog [Pectinophora gossypiella]|uniref:protein 4.1 homolog n=1 Tax=Pectinophora gossypiella TaxID=13191 RepID=UPI00214F5870|nr:protein 4.1 homolog [Pectinophora gossypiella]XP_049880141.1 protein 4.1 homolog [Pectinophora gossypiella]XP_049880142.1 protein 4.1 homolog [Pectinophora gossypiella]XP_049880143.1 protein 4.1 homolog [Pectinophora gossypiella]XP_049880144.1 protein 4.1 homolog [Pectinophora gossypiella]
MRESLRRLASDDGMSARTSRVAGTRRVRIELLDGEHINIDIDRKARGADLVDKVCESLDLVETDYFGLLHAQRGDPRVWVDLGRRLSKTFRNEPWDVRLAVKFYPPEPSELRDDVTRYQLGLAVRRDLMESRLSCSTITYALLASYILQAELGDYEEGHMRPAVLTEHRVAPINVLDDELEEKIRELYRKHKGQTPAEAELNYLENAKKLALYGAELHCACDSDDIDIVLAVCAHGISIYRDGLLMNRFPWAKILKISYNKRAYTLRLRASEFDEFETHLGFKLPSTRACKKLWKCSVEHHIFFRRETPVKVERVSGFPRLGSRRLSCRRTLRQLRAEPLLREVTA